jgi:DNA-binding transcriptional MerR regulator
MNEGLTIQQVAQRTGLSIHTLRYYERLGLLTSVHRLPNGHRRYDDGDLRWIDLLKCLRASAMPISEMQRFAEITRQGTATASERRELLEAHRLKVVAQFQEIQHTLAHLDTKIARLHAVEIEQERDTEKVGEKL